MGGGGGEGLGDLVAEQHRDRPTPSKGASKGDFSFLVLNEQKSNCQGQKIKRQRKKPTVNDKKPSVNEITNVDETHPIVNE